MSHEAGLRLLAMEAVNNILIVQWNLMSAMFLYI